MHPLKKKILSLTLLLMVGNSMLFAQPDFYQKQFERDRDSAVDGLRRHPRPDTAREKALMNVIDCASFLSQKRQVLPYYNEAIALSRKLRSKEAEAFLLGWMGGFYKSQQKYDSAILYLDSSVLVTDTASGANYRRTRGFALFNKGMIYEMQANYYKALNGYFESLKNYDSIDLYKQKIIFIRLASIYQNLRNDEKALQYYKATLEAIKKLNDSRMPVEAEGIYTSIADIYFNRGDIRQARSWLYQSASSMPDSTETLVTGDYFHLAGRIALKENKPDSAIYYLSMALKYYDYTRPMHMDVISNLSADMGRLKLATGDLPEAKTYALESINAAKKSGRKDALANALIAMAGYYHKTGNQSKAYLALSQATALNDSVLTEANIKQANTLSAIYENDKKEKEIARLQVDKKIQSDAVQQQTLLNIIFLVAIFALLVVVFAVYLNFKKNQKIGRQRFAELEIEKQLMGIEAMLKGQEEERRRLARDLHDSLGSMLSGVKISFSTLRDNIEMTPDHTAAYDKTLEQLDKTIAELRKVAHNLMPEALALFGLKSAIKDFCESLRLAGNTEIICEQFGADRELGNIADLNVYRIIQELINNAINHGKAARILVQITKTDDKILITVEDDGKGFDLERLKHASGIGWTNIQSRVNYFNGVIDIDSKPREGTTINIELIA